jgi:azurin
MKLPVSFLLLAFAAAPAFAADPPAPNPASAASTPSTPSTPSTTATPKPAKSAKKKSVKIAVEMKDGMQFDPPRFEVKPGDDVTVSLENTDSTHQPHNFLVLMPGKRMEVVMQSLALGEKGPAQEFVPVNPAIIVHSSLLNPDGATTVHFTMPAEKGIYPYICSMPGHGMIMYGAIYSGVKMPALAKDKNIPPQAAQVAMPGGGQRPYIQRIFMPNSGPASIAVALPGNLNYCWDAGECRLRYVWRGAFIDASAHWRGNGKELAAVPAEPWWSAGIGTFPFKIADAGAAPAVKFLGYKIGAGIPEFHYDIGETEVFEKITPAPDDKGLTLHFRIPKAAHPLEFNLTSANAKLTSSVGAFDSGALRLTPAQAADFTVTLTDSTAH